MPSWKYNYSGGAYTNLDPLSSLILYTPLLQSSRRGDMLPQKLTMQKAAPDIRYLDIWVGWPVQVQLLFLDTLYLVHTGTQQGFGYCCS